MRTRVLNLDTHRHHYEDLAQALNFARGRFVWRCRICDKTVASMDPAEFMDLTSGAELKQLIEQQLLPPVATP